WCARWMCVCVCVRVCERWERSRGSKNRAEPDRTGSGAPGELLQDSCKNSGRKIRTHTPGPQHTKQHTHTHKHTHKHTHSPLWDETRLIYSLLKLLLEFLS